MALGIPLKEEAEFEPYAARGAAFTQVKIPIGFPGLFCIFFRITYNWFEVSGVVGAYLIDYSTHLAPLRCEDYWGFHNWRADPFFIAALSRATL